MENLRNLIYDVACHLQLTSDGYCKHTSHVRVLIRVHTCIIVHVQCKYMHMYSVHVSVHVLIHNTCAYTCTKIHVTQQVYYAQLHDFVCLECFVHLPISPTQSRTTHY